MGGEAAFVVSVVLVVMAAGLVECVASMMTVGACDTAGWAEAMDEVVLQSQGRIKVPSE